MREIAKTLTGAGTALLLGCAAPPPAPHAAVPAEVAARQAAALAVEPAAPPVAWPAAADCRDLAAAIGRLPAAEAARLDPASAPLALAAGLGPDQLPPAEVATLDLPLPVDDGGAPCVLLLTAGSTARAAPRRPLEHATVRSTYRAGGGKRANPEYRRLQQELRRVARSDGIDFLATGDPAVDLVGLIAGSVLQGIGAAMDGRAEAALRAELAATSPTIDEPAWEPYTFEVTTIEAARSGRLQARLVDRVRDLAWSLDEPVLERRRLRVAVGRRARDRGLLESGGDGLVAMTDVAVWEQAGLRPSLAGMLAALGARGDSGAPEPTGAPDLARTDDRLPAPAAGPPADASPPPAPELAGAVEAGVGADGVRRFRLRASGTAAPESTLP